MQTPQVFYLEVDMRQRYSTMHCVAGMAGTAILILGAASGIARDFADSLSHFSPSPDRPATGAL
jgi:hypothetical protein